MRPSLSIWSGDMTGSSPTRQSWRRVSCTVAAGLAVAAAALAMTVPVRAQAPVPPAEQYVHTLNPALYEAAREFFPSDDTAAPTFPTHRIFRLTRQQFDATIASLLPDYAKRSIKTAVAKDPLQTNYEYADLLSFNPANIRGYKAWVGEITEAVKADPSRIVNCTARKNTPDCLRGEALRFVIKAYRGSGRDDEDQKLLKTADFFVNSVAAVGLNQATADLVEVVLNSPHFLYSKEVHLTGAKRKHGRLPPAQLLALMTYTLADVPPEALRLDSDAALQHVQTPGDRQATISAILASKASREKLVRFFKAWLEVRDPGEFTISQQIFKDFTDTTATAMLAETDSFLRDALAKPTPRLLDITHATRTFVSKALEPIYATKADDPAGTKAIDLNRAQRLGIFTHPAVLASHSGPTNSAPIKRGVFFARKIMCVDLEPPPQGLDLTIYEKPGATERQRIEAVTGQNACVGCHKIIDPLGFFQESYDALGRWRTQEEGQPIDASMHAAFLGKDVPKTTTAVEALKALTATSQFKQCFVRQLFRFYMARKEDPSDDRLLREMFVTFAHNDSQDILALVRLLANSDRVSMRQPGQPGPTSQ